MFKFKNFHQSCFFIVAFTITFASGCKTNPDTMSSTQIVPPLVEAIPYQHKIHDHIRVDPYYWLNQRENSEVLDYLDRENDYYQKMTAHTQPLQKQLYEE